MAMYRAKEKGRNAFEFFACGMGTAMLADFKLENELRQALKAGQFVLHISPSFTSVAEIVGVEALIRWQHPEHGLARQPASFHLQSAAG